MKQENGFTLVELLVVVAVVAVLAAILMPVFVTAKHSGHASACKSNMKQIGMALLLYAGDHDDTFSRCDFRYGPNGIYVCDGHDWGKWFWMFTCRPYMSSRRPADLQSGMPGSNVFVCPSRPVFHKLTKGGQVNALYRGGLAAKWGLTLGPIPGEKNQGYAMWCSYGINEHVPYAHWHIRDWQRPTKSFLLFEASDTELTSDQMYYKLNYDAHSNGTNILFIDGHAKWHKSVYTGDPSDSKTGKNVVWEFPPGGPHGGLGPLPDDTGKDRGGWTASASDDY